MVMCTVELASRLLNLRTSGNALGVSFLSGMIR